MYYPTFWGLKLLLLLEVFLSQFKYIMSVIKRDHRTDTKTIGTPLETNA